MLSRLLTNVDIMFLLRCVFMTTAFELFEVCVFVLLGKEHGDCGFLRPLCYIFVGGIVGVLLGVVMFLLCPTDQIYWVVLLPVMAVMVFVNAGMYDIFGLNNAEERNNSNE